MTVIAQPIGLGWNPQVSAKKVDDMGEDFKQRVGEAHAADIARLDKQAASQRDTWLMDAIMSMFKLIRLFLGMIIRAIFRFFGIELKPKDKDGSKDAQVLMGDPQVRPQVITDWDIFDGKSAPARSSLSPEGVILDGEEYVRPYEARQIGNKCLLPAAEAESMVNKAELQVLERVEDALNDPETQAKIEELLGEGKVHEAATLAIMAAGIADEQKLAQLENQVRKLIDDILVEAIQDPNLREAAASELVSGLPNLSAHATLDDSVLQRVGSRLMDHPYVIEQIIMLKAAIGAASHAFKDTFISRITDGERPEDKGPNFDRKHPFHGKRTDGGQESDGSGASHRPRG